MKLVIFDVFFVIFIVLKFIVSLSLSYLDGVMGFVFCKFVIGGNLVWIFGVFLVVILFVIVVERYYFVVYL